MPLATIILLIAATVCAAAGVVLLKVGATGRTELLAFVNPYIAAGLVLCALAAGLWIYVMSKRSLTSIYPFTILGFLLVYLSGVVLLGELPSRSAVIGVALILIGLYLVARDAT